MVLGPRTSVGNSLSFLLRANIRVSEAAICIDPFTN